MGRALSNSYGSLVVYDHCFQGPRGSLARIALFTGPQITGSELETAGTRIRTVTTTLHLLPLSMQSTFWGGTLQRELND